MYVNGYSLCLCLNILEQRFFYLPFSIVSLETNFDVKDDRTLFLIHAFEGSILKDERPTWIPLSKE